MCRNDTGKGSHSSTVQLLPGASWDLLWLIKPSTTLKGPFPALFYSRPKLQGLCGLPCLNHCQGPLHSWGSSYPGYTFYCHSSQHCSSLGSYIESLLRKEPVKDVCARFRDPPGDTEASNDKPLAVIGGGARRRHSFPGGWKELKRLRRELRSGSYL